VCDPPRTRRPTLGVHFGAQRARREGPQNLKIPTVTASIIMASCVLYLVFVKYELNTSLFFRRPQNRSLPRLIVTASALIT